MAAAEEAYARSWWADEEGARYERGRPEYPPGVIELLRDRVPLRPTTRLLDVAAGTGKLTRLLTTTPARVAAVEPMPGMRAQLRRQVPAAALLAGRAEQLPLASETVDAVTVAQAFHWFDVPVAARELHRVLRPGGRLVLVTNKRHTPQPWLRELWDVLRRYERRAPVAGTIRHWRQALDDTGYFGGFEHYELHNEQRFADIGELDARFLSISFVILLPKEDRRELLRDVHRVVDGIDPLVVPLRTDVDIAVRRD